MELLELFKGTGSVGKVAKKMGFNVVSLDFDEKLFDKSFDVSVSLLFKLFLAKYILI